MCERRIENESTVLLSYNVLLLLIMRCHVVVVYRSTAVSELDEAKESSGDWKSVVASQLPPLKHS